MVMVRPFAALHYDWDRGDPASLIAPPYDVIDEQTERRLRERSPFNAVRLILPEDEGDLDRYAAAAATLDRWTKEGVLRRDDRPAFYIYRQTFQAGGRAHTRTGFFASVGLEEFETGSIFPHERTMSGPKEDRFRLLSATHMNLSPVFGLLRDDEGTVSALLADAWSAPDLEFEEGGVHHAFAALADPDVMGKIVAACRPRDVFIADGHHRYETALRYRRENAPDAPLDDPRASVLMFCVSTSDPGLVVLPTHRVFSLPSRVTLEDVRRKLGGSAALVETFEGDSVVEDVARALHRHDVPHAFGLVLAAGRRGATIEWTAPSDESTCVGGVTLDVLILHHRIVPALTDCDAPAVRYSHDLDEVARQVAAGDNKLGVLLEATPVRSIVAVAGGRRRLPPKTTFFYPKIPSALVFRPLAEQVGIHGKGGAP